MLRSFLTFRNLLQLWAAVIGAWSLLAASPAAAFEADPRWGFLAEMAEHDWIYGSFIAESVVAARWKIPNRKLNFNQWSGDRSLVMSFELDPETGKLTAHVFGPESPASAIALNSKGSFSIDAGVFGIVPFARKEADGQYWFRYTNGTKWIYRPLPPADPKYARLARVIAAGKERAAEPSRMGMAASTGVSPSAVAAPATAQTSQAVAELSLSATLATIPLGPRIALVIGKGTYGPSIGSLANPADDADAIAAALKTLGFTVHLVKNADQKTMKHAIVRLGQRLTSAGKGATGLFFYAGHGLQHRGINYLVLVGAEINTQADIDIEAVGADSVLEQMEEAGAATNVVILDACRNMPLVRGFRSATNGLAPMDAPNGSFIAYSTAPGSVAADGAGANSPFVTALIKNLGHKGESIESIFRDVRREVLASTEGTQTPWDSSSLIQPFYFAGN